ncbi:MAG: serpin family protein [Ruminococcus sp.]|uniref:serpin family protein n=1 Tax=Ruminococcus sp. TaxID=41978 RepID=UPI0025D746A3|nr:serpin family protein [Ruminococcus sp.]MBO4868020.1 serpin family protein [Ruminococcus sp.]
MKNTYLKRTICTALAGLMMALTACGNVTEDRESPASKKTEPDTASSAAEPDNGDKPAESEISLTVKPLSSVTLEKSDEMPDDDFNASYRNYAAEFFKTACAEDIKAGNNVMISPESVMMALGMTANGAKGETLSEMEKALGGQGIDVVNKAMQYRMTKFMNSEDISFNVANSVWVRDDADRIKMKQSFCDKVKSVYNADSFLAPFDDTTLGDINSWVNNNTNGMIPSILNRISESAVAYLVNAMAFEGEWAEPYEDAQVNEDDTFTNSNGEKEKVTMLYSEEGGYFEDENTTGFLKYYKGNEYAFMAMLPAEGTDMADYVAGLDGEKLKKLWDNADGSVNVCIPEFTYDYDRELSNDLKAMGMNIPFTDGADFSEMAETGSGSLYIDQVIHKTHIELDRNGTKAAAATSVVMTDGCMLIDEVKEVKLNRPFVYAIIDTESGTPVFMGAVNTVNG